ncbi:MAG: HAD family hydrolase [Aquisalimonadaceae bacterium]
MSGACPIDMSFIKGVVFDLDGTLVDSRLNFDAIRREIGFPRDRGLLEHLTTLTDPNQISMAETAIHRHEMAGAAAATWMPGAQRLLTALHAMRIPTAILTRNMRAAVRLTIDSLAVPIDLVLTREDCKPKPDPEGLLHIAKAWGLHTRSVVYVGDFIFDIQAARNAGMVSCLYGNGTSGKYAREADWVINHFDELTMALGGNDDAARPTADTRRAPGNTGGKPQSKRTTR